MWETWPKVQASVETQKVNEVNTTSKWLTKVFSWTDKPKELKIWITKSLSEKYWVSEDVTKEMIAVLEVYYKLSEFKKDWWEVTKDLTYLAWDNKIPANLPNYLKDKDIELPLAV